MSIPADNMACIDLSVLQKYLVGSLSQTESEQVENHIEDCAECESNLAQQLDKRWLSSSRAGIDANLEEAPDLPAYECLELIDTGGFGVVWKMRDRQFNRVVAVKVMKSRDAARPALVRRFFAEAQICSQLSHPFIVSIHNMGRATDGRAWYAMRYVTGARLDQAFSISETNLISRVQTFEKVCQAVAYAHSKKVVHRDLKPQNVIVGDHGEVQVMDWGVAKVIQENAEQTADDNQTTVVETARLSSDQTMGGGLGTYPYMPPEQARHGEQADFRSDVFSLGAILCQLLTNSPPYADRDLATLREKAAVGNLSDAHQRLAACGADQRIVDLAIGCLSADPQARPTDASVLANRVRAFLTDVEQELQFERVENEKRKLQLVENQKKKKLWFALSSALLLALGIATVAFLVTNSALKREGKALDESESLAASNLTLAENRKEVLDFLTGKVFGQANPKNESNRQITFREVLDNATDEARKTEMAPEVKAEILIELGRVYFDLSEYQLSLELFSEAHDTIEPAMGPRHPAAMTALDQKAMTLIRMERFDEAEPVLLRAIELQNVVLGPDHEDSVHSQAKLGDLYGFIGDYERAIEITEEVLDRRRRLWGDEYQFTLVSLNGLSLAYIKVERFEEAVACLREAVETSKKIHGPDHPNTLAFKNNLALALLDIEGGLEEASQLAEESLFGREKVYPSTSSNIFASRHTVALVRYEMGGEENWRQVLEQCKSILGDFPDPSVRHGSVLTLKARCLIKLEQFQTAKEALLLADEMLASILGADNYHSQKARNLLAELP